MHFNGIRIHLHLLACNNFRILLSALISTEMCIHFAALVSLVLYKRHDFQNGTRLWNFEIRNSFVFLEVSLFCRRDSPNRFRLRHRHGKFRTSKKHCIYTWSVLTLHSVVGLSFCKLNVITKFLIKRLGSCDGECCPHELSFNSLLYATLKFTR